jgi:proton-dependent oligopeptide transporter, POT family
MIENQQVSQTGQPAALDTGFFGHPRGLSTLYFTEMWERFSYYGMRALLILFMTASVERGGLGFSDSKAGAIYGLYTAMVYLLGLPGGWVADRLIGARKAVLWGGIIIAIGHFCLTFQSMELFSLGLCFIVIGTGLLKPNVSSMVGSLYSKDDPRRDAGFSIFYMGINLGAFISPLICGYLGERINWHYGFAAAGIGMTLGVIQYVLGQKSLGNAGKFEAASGPDELQRDWRSFKLGIGAIAAAIVLGGALVVNGRTSIEGLADLVGYGLLAITVLTFGWLIFGGSWTREERRRYVVIFVLFLAACLFWSAFEQAGSTLNLFADRNTERTMFGYEYPASWFQSVNSLFIITLAPVVGWLWLRLGRREPSSPAKFAWGLFLVGAGFVVMALGAMAASGGVRVSALFLWTCYFLHTVGELCLSPVGLSAMTRLAPVRAAGFVMGIWFLASSVGNYIGGRVSSIYEAFSPTTLFWAVAAFCMAIAGVLAMLAPTVRRLSGDAEKKSQH